MIAVFSTFDPAALGLAPAFCGHYRALGADQIRVILQLEPTTTPEQRARETERAEDVLGRAGARLENVLVAAFDAITLRRNHNWRQNLLPKRFEWIVWADSDELQEHPGGLQATAEALQREGRDARIGRLVDRFARNGRLPHLGEGASLWEAFPLGADFTGRVLGARTDKVVMARRETRIGVGNHRLRGRPPPAPGEPVIPVHHFKWDASVTERLRRRLDPDWKARCRWWTVSATALDRIAERAGRVPLDGLDVTDFADDLPGLGAGPLSGNPAYTGGPYWGADQLATVNGTPSCSIHA
jgi:hypothetical protein